MNSKLILFSIFILFNSFNAKGQLLDKLKQRAKEKGLETREISYDSTAVNKDKNNDNVQEIELETLSDFFSTDVIMYIYNENDQLTLTSFFDADKIAMRSKKEDNPKPLYQDQKGKLYVYDHNEKRYAITSILPASSMGFMSLGMAEIYKLPQEPYAEALLFLAERDTALDFMKVELAFIYKPQHFLENDLYSAEDVKCNGNQSCIRFNYTDLEYKGSYMQFDAKRRLVEFNIETTNTSFLGGTENMSGKFIYTYEGCNVELPDAVEQSLIPGPLGKMLNLERGLEPGKHNKKDNQKN